ncbi:uncharacterized protein LOC108742424 [Agrilus planipennis]|uniref:Uncharacterized protein LOC108742424 n=1 Tax=Agrilus planipennis TaxID=224129 RepID=A0A1W4XK28_AGRPL|nr:uncharacterized protein LOC108742424 [Agrilus planipennis]
MLCLICGSRVSRAKATAVTGPPEDSSLLYYLQMCMIVDAFPKESISYVCSNCIGEIYQCSETLNKISLTRHLNKKDKTANRSLSKCFLCGVTDKIRTVRLSEIDSKRIIVNKLLGYSQSTFPFIFSCDICYKVLNDLHHIHENIFKTSMKVAD